jgi:hypothetical protein
MPAIIIWRFGLNSCRIIKKMTPKQEGKRLLFITVTGQLFITMTVTLLAGR